MSKLALSILSTTSSVLIFHVALTSSATQLETQWEVKQAEITLREMVVVAPELKTEE
jgi:hypothetical protein